MRPFGSWLADVRPPRLALRKLLRSPLAMKGMQYDVGHMVGGVEADSDVAQDVGMVEVLHESTFSQVGLQLLLGRVACMQQGHVFTTCNRDMCLQHATGTCVHYMQ